MGNNINKQLIEQLENLKNASFALSSAWLDADEKADDILTENYPFKESFEEVAIKISAWSREVTKKLQDERGT